MNLQSLLGEGGVFVMTIQAKDADPWQGVVALEGDSIANMLMRYMQQSEQLDTFIRLAADENTSSGLLIQRLPEENVEDDAWQTISALAETTSNEELLQLQAEEMLYRLFHEYPLRVFEAENIEFACTCSHEKVSNMLLLLGGEEIGNILAEEGSVEINCDFCQQKYVFDEDDAQKLFGVDLVAAVKKQ
jgi:molecular chaperone Hsp33